MDHQSFSEDVTACRRARDRSRFFGEVAGFFTVGLWSNAAQIAKSERQLLEAEEDLLRLKKLKTDICRLREALDESVEDNGVRVAVCVFPDVMLDGKQTYGPYWETLRREVLERDGYQCCHEDGSCNGPLQIHHARPLSRGGTNDLANLMTLCRYHHGLQHPDNPVFKR